MEQHKKLSGLPNDPIMVLPQGSFSSVSMKALKDQGYFAAFNSTINTTDTGKLPPEEHRKAVIKAYHSFSLFLRRYHRDKSLFMQDILSLSTITPSEKDINLSPI